MSRHRGIEHARMASGISGVATPCRRCPYNKSLRVAVAMCTRRCHYHSRHYDGIIPHSWCSPAAPCLLGQQLLPLPMCERWHPHANMFNLRNANLRCGGSVWRYYVVVTAYAQQDRGGCIGALNSVSMTRATPVVHPWRRRLIAPVGAVGAKLWLWEHRHSLSHVWRVQAGSRDMSACGRAALSVYALRCENSMWCSITLAAWQGHGQDDQIALLRRVFDLPAQLSWHTTLQKNV